MDISIKKLSYYDKCSNVMSPPVCDAIIPQLMRYVDVCSGYPHVISSCFINIKILDV